MGRRIAISLALLMAAACADESPPATEVSAESVIPIEPWEPIDPGFVGCEGG